jgi:uncharacterized membrane protein YbaN (DUF454 family)
MERNRQNAGQAPGEIASRCGLRYALIGLGWINVGLGAIGIIVPGMPTTVFLLIALWAFSKSSERFRTWLYEHRRLGPPIRAWHQHGVIPARAKAAALAMMTLSLTIMAATGAWQLPVIAGAIMVPVAVFIVSRPSRPGGEACSYDRPTS